MTTFNGPLHEMATTTPTQYLNDSCSVEELTYAIARGSVGATSNPVIVGNVLKKEMHLWRDPIANAIKHGAKLMLPVHERTGGKLGRLSIQTDPAAYNNPQAMLRQTEYFAGLAPNMQVKFPCTSAGVSIIEEATYRGVNLNVTVSFCVPQVMAIAEAVERGLRRREAEGLDEAAGEARWH
jgi:transaldolase